MALSAEQARHTENVFHIALKEKIVWTKVDVDSAVPTS